MDLFNSILKYWNNKKLWNDDRKKEYILNNLYNSSKGKPKRLLLNILGINKLNSSSDWISIIQNFENSILISSNAIEEFILNYYLLHEFIRNVELCEEYADLNQRSLSLLDIFIFENDKIKLDLYFEYLFKSIDKELLINEEELNETDYRFFLEKIIDQLMLYIIF